MSIDRSYQPALIDAARNKLREIQGRIPSRKPRLMVTLPCGGGKTRIAGMIIQSALERGGRALFLAHRSFLMTQTSETFNEMGIRHSFIAAGKPFNPHAKVHVGMVGSAKSRLPKLKHKPTLICLDEGHHGVASVWRWISDNCPDATILYLSATPGHRTDGVGLDEVCDDIVVGPQVRELIAMGALSDFKWMVGEPIDGLDKVGKRGGDYAPEKQGAIMRGRAVVGKIVDNYVKNAMGKKAIYFFPDIATSKDYAEAFCSAGAPFAHLDKDTPDHERRRIARKIADGELMGFCNAFIAGEGFDLAAQAGKDVTIEVVGLCRLTASFPLLVQMSMRAMRAKPYPGIIYDHAGNYHQHDCWLPSDDIEWTLSGERRVPKAVKPVQCPHCLATDYPDGNKCRHCKKDVREVIRAAVARAKMEEIEGQLQEVRRREEAEAAANAAALAHEKKVARWRCKTEDEYYAYAVKYGIKSPRWWAKQQASGAWRRRA